MAGPAARIAIIGGGIAGCAAARRLSDLGAGRVTIFEAEERIGGKLCTRTLDGKPFELGAVVMTGAYVNTHALLRRFGLSTDASFHIRHFDSERRSFREPPPTLALIRQLRAFRAHMARHSDRLSEPGSWSLDAENCRPFSEWATARGFPLVCDPLTTIVTCLGYGRLDDIPAAYVLKFMHRRTVAAAIVSRLWSRIVPHRLNWRAPPVRMVRSGMQRLPECLSADLDVCLGARVEAIAGRAGDYTLSWKTPAGSRSENFDAIVFATVPRGIDGLDRILPQAVREPISRLHHRHYTTILCRADGVTAGCYTYFDRRDGQAVPPSSDRLACILRPHPTSNGCVLYHTGDAVLSDEQLKDIAARGLAETDASLRDIVEIRRWNYFPHFDGPDLARQPFDAFEAAQGVDGLYYVGAYLDFETVENSLATTLKVIDRHFGRPATPGP